MVQHQEVSPIHKNKLKSVNGGAQFEFKLNKCIIIEREGEKKKNFLITIVGKVRTGTRCHNSGIYLTIMKTQQMLVATQKVNYNPQSIRTITIHCQA